MNAAGLTMRNGPPFKAGGIRVAWLLPTVKSQNYWQPLLREFAKLFPQTVLFTGAWAGFLPGCEGTFEVKMVGEFRTLALPRGGHVADSGYEGLNLYSPAILGELRRYKADVIFTSAFGLWTLCALGHKFLAHAKVVVLLDGISESTEYLRSPRLPLRKLIARRADFAVGNSLAACQYLQCELGMRPHKVQHHAYLVPDVSTLRAGRGEPMPVGSAAHPNFLFVGQIIERKGWRYLLEAVHLLMQRGRRDFSVSMIGNGHEMPQLRESIRLLELGKVVAAPGPVPYEDLWKCYENCDVFILPALEDVWGMVVSEAMAFGKAVLCTKHAGAAELVRDGTNGFVFDPRDPAELAAHMEKFLDQPTLVSQFGANAKAAVALHTPQNAAREMAEVVSIVLNEHSAAYEPV